MVFIRQLIGFLIFLLMSMAAVAQCTKDIECRADRICEKGACIWPPTTPAASAPVPSKANKVPQSLPAQSLKSDDVLPTFTDFEAPIYRGQIYAPKGLRRVGPREWRDEFNKLVASPEVNFAGKYSITLHSCGTSCRFFTMADLSTGRGLDVLASFASAEPRPKTKEGYEYTTDLIGRPGSRLLVAQYHIAVTPENEECRERMFVLENEKLRPITSTRKGCGKY